MNKYNPMQNIEIQRNISHSVAFFLGCKKATESTMSILRKSTLFRYVHKRKKPLITLIIKGFL